MVLVTQTLFWLSFILKVLIGLNDLFLFINHEPMWGGVGVVKGVFASQALKIWGFKSNFSMFLGFYMLFFGIFGDFGY